MKLISKRRGKTGQIQQEIYDSLLPVIQKYESGRVTSQKNDRFWGLVYSSVDNIRSYTMPAKFRQ